MKEVMDEVHQPRNWLRNISLCIKVGINNNDNINLVGNFDAQSVEINFLETLHAKNQLQL